MADLGVQPLGPLFGPDFVMVFVDDPAAGHFELEVFPDAANPTLRANGLAAQYYYLPQRIYLAKKQSSPADFDLSVTLFKGLMTAEDTLGVAGTPTTGGEVDAGGAFVAFSTTMAVPDSVVAAALAKLKAQQHDPPPPRILQFFAMASSDPAPLLGIVPITDNQVTIEVPPLAGTDSKSFFVNAQGKGQGSIEAAGISSFLVTCGQDAAGAIVGALKAGQSPFTVHYNLSALFYMNACEVAIHVDVDKVFDQFSGAAEAKYGFAQADLTANYQSCLTSGGITTVINQNGAVMDADTKKLVDTTVNEMQTRAWDMVKSEIFDWQPKPDTPATASTGPCGGADVSLKFNYQKHGVKFDDSFTLNETVTKQTGVSGDLSELQPVIKANLNKYLAIVDIGEFFKKIQVAASPNIDWSSPDTADPIAAASIEVAYPSLGGDGNAQMGPDGRPVLTTHTDGFHYQANAVNLAAPSSLARWTRDNPNDIINVSFLRMGQSSPGWDANQVQITKKLSYHPDDARVDLANGTSEIVVTSVGSDHAPTIGPSDVGYIYVVFVVDRPLPVNVSVTLTVSFGTRTDTLAMTSPGPLKPPTATWQVWSDKYFNESVVKVQIAVEVAPPMSDFSSAAVTWGGSQAFALNLGHVKRPTAPLKIVLPPQPDPTLNATVARYVLQAQKEAAGTS